jgi:predicted RNase H-like HicB family nuclease
VNRVLERKAKREDAAFSARKEERMRVFTAVVEKCGETGLYVGYVPGFPGAHSQAETLDELNVNLREVIEMLLEEGDPKIETVFVGTQNVVVA